MDDARLLLVIAPAPGALPVRVPVAKAITTIGSGPEADIRLAGSAPAWAVLRRTEAGLTLQHLATGTHHALVPGEPHIFDGITIGCETLTEDLGLGPTLDTLSTRLADVEHAEDALRVLLEAAIAAADASHGAIIVTDRGSYRVALAVNADGENLDDAKELLSDTLVRDVLGSGTPVRLADAMRHARYAAVPSVVSLELRSVLCLPMGSPGRALGALFLGKRNADAPFADRLVADLEVVTALSVPLLAQLRRADAMAGVATPSATDELVGESNAMIRVRALATRLGSSELSVLVLGESGTGKELVARALHRSSARCEQKLVALNCASVPESLLSAELFGYRRGAFTGATSDRAGLIETADNSTLFLDEVGDMPMAMQSALLRVLEEREVTRLGEHESRPVNFRLIAATHRDLNRAVADGTFRQDLLFRLQEVTLQLPPLRNRDDDVILLAHLFLRQAESQLSLRDHHISKPTEEALRKHRWPGNVRELRATMRRAAVLAEGATVNRGDLQLSADLPVSAGAVPDTAKPSHDHDLDTTRPLNEARDAFVIQYVTAVLEREGGNREAAAKALGIGLRTLYRYIS